MISEWEISACAQQVLKQHGGKASEFAASRIDELGNSQDAEGVATWKAIATRIDQLTDFRSPGTPR